MYGKGPTKGCEGPYDRVAMQSCSKGWGCDAGSGKGWAAMGADPGNKVWASTGDPEKDDLVWKVKGIQRSSNEGKEQWYAFCDASRTGNRDPSRHTTASLTNFLESYYRGEPPEARASSASGDGRVVRMRGVPFQSDCHDVVQFLSEYGIDSSNVALGCGDDGRPTGEAYVVFPSKPHADRALDEKQRQEIKGRYIELFRSSYDEMNQASRKPGASAVSSWSGAPGVRSEDAEKEELVSRVKAVQRSGQDGKEYWYAYCDAARTGNRDPSRHSNESLKSFLEAHRQGEPVDTFAARAGGDGRVVRMRGVPFQSDALDVVEFLSEYGVDRSQVTLGCGEDGRPTGVAYVIFPTAELADRALDEKQKHEIRGRYIELFRSSYEEQGEAVRMHERYGSKRETGIDPQKEELVSRVKWIQRSGEEGKKQWYAFCDATRTGNRDPNRHTEESLSMFLDAYAKGESPELHAALAGGDGRVLRLRGVPFQSDVLDVVDFVREYGVEQTDVSLGCSSGGKATGEAYVVFPTAELAERALDEKQKHEIRGRYIELFKSSHEEKERGSVSSPAGAAQLALTHASGFSEDSGKAELVDRVKRIQRNSFEGKEQWYAYCDATRTGNRDPSRHTAESLSNFLEAYARGEPVEAGAARTGGDGRVLRLRGVPYQCEASDVAAFLEEYSVEPSQVTLGWGSDKRRNGEAFAVFRSKELADLALDEKQKHEIKGRYIELFKSSYEERDESKNNAMAIVPFAGDVAGNMDKPELVASVKRIQKASDAGRQQWDDYCDAMHTGSRDPSRHTAEAMRTFVEAYERGERAVPRATGDGRVLRLRGVPFQSDVSDLAQFLAEYGADKTQAVIARGSDGRPTGEAFVILPTADAANRALVEMQRREIRGRYIELFRSNNEEYSEAMIIADAYAPSSGDPEKDECVTRVKTIQRTDQNGKEKWYVYCDAMRTGSRDPSKHTVEFMRDFLDAYDRGETPVPRVSGDGRVLRLRGVPFQSDALDVVQFLQDFGVDKSGVTLGCRPDGKPTGEAFAVFPTQELAEQALDVMQKKDIRGRYIELFRSSYDERDQHGKDDGAGPGSGGRKRSAEAAGMSPAGGREDSGGGFWGSGEDSGPWGSPWGPSPMSLWGSSSAWDGCGKGKCKGWDPFVAWGKGGCWGPWSDSCGKGSSCDPWSSSSKGSDFYAEKGMKGKGKWDLYGPCGKDGPYGKGGADGSWGPYSKGAMGNAKGWDVSSSWGAGKGGDPSDDSFGPTGKGLWGGSPKGGPGKGWAPMGKALMNDAWGPSGEASQAA